MSALSRSQTKPAEPAAQALPLGDALSFLQVLWALTHGLESTSKRMLATLGITGPQRLVLRIVGHYGRIAAGELAEVLHIHPSSLTGMLRRLEYAELIRRESDPFDRRRALFKLTRRGVRLNGQRRGTIEEAVATTLARQPRERVAATKAVLRALAESLDANLTPSSASERGMSAPALATAPPPKGRSKARA
ncbi:MAG: MarR family transcriptional regulator [Myxococcales bacterium]|nr:MAG: MarR family transcriptional regulator [Myxococcales bacterium]